MKRYTSYNPNYVSCKWALTILLITALFGEIYSQNYPTYNGYFLNPFVYNPAAAATDHLQVTASYRRQWFGVSGAPSISSVTASSSLDGTRAALGFKMSNFTRGIFNSTDASVSYAYGVPLNKATRLFFGLSAGVLSNTINNSNVSSDPELASMSASSFVPSASFGLLLKNNSGLNLGFVLPKFFGTQDLNSKGTYSYLDNLIVTAAFSRWQPSKKHLKKGKRNINTNVPLEFFTIYRYSSIGGLYEATGKYNLNSNLWISATYRQYAGVIPGIGITKDNFAFSYFYEPGIGGDLPLKTHELQLQLQLGKEKKFKERKPIAPSSKVAVNPPKAPKVGAGKPTLTQKVLTRKEEPKNDEPIKPAQPPVVAQNQVKRDSVIKHRPRFEKQFKVIDEPYAVPVTKDTAALDNAHREERKQLDEHIQEYAKGKHNDAHNEPVNERHDFVKRGTHHEELHVATYVIAGAFQSRANAEHYVKNLKALGYADADFGHQSARNLWYVFIAKETEISKAKANRNELQKNKIFKNVWLLTVQP